MVYVTLIIMFNPLSILFNHMANHKLQNLAKTILGQHFIDNVVCFHPLGKLQHL
jgi:hypothetical protein